MEIDPIPLGNGAYGIVYRITNSQPPAVIKYLPKRTSTDCEVIYRRECEAMRNLRHKNIVQYLGAEEGRVNGEWCLGIVLEYCERGALTNVIFDRRVVYNVYTVAHWAEEMFDAVAYLQANSAIHRDIKPDNILVKEDWTLKLSDFGCVVNGDKTLAMAGTYRYMSPEAYNLQSNHKSDVYALGLVLWEIMERRRVFSEFNHDLSQFVNELREGNITVPIPPNKDDKLWELIEFCTRIPSESRPSSTEARAKASDYRQELELTTTLDFRPTIEQERRSLKKPYNSAPIVAQPLMDSSLLSVKNVTFGTSSMLALGNQLDEPSTRIANQPPNLSASIKMASFGRTIELLPEELCEKFFFLAPHIITKKLEERYVFAYERSPAFDAVKTFGYGTVERLVEDVLDQDFHDQFLLYRSFFELTQQLQQPAIGSWDLLEKVSRVVKELEALRERHTKRFYFRCYFFTATKEEFLFFHDEAKQAYFIRRDLNQFRVLPGSWITDRCFMETVPRKDRYAQLIYDKLIDDPKMHYLRDESVDLDQIIAAMDRIKYRLENFAHVQAMNFVNPQVFREATAVDMLTEATPDYVFQLRNPPRHLCLCNPRCPIIGGFPSAVPQESQLIYHACADEETIEQLELYATFCKKLFYLQRNYSTNFKNYDPRSIEQEDRLLETKFKESSLQFFIFRDRYEHMLLLDHPDNYDPSEKIPCVNSCFHFYTWAHNQPTKKLIRFDKPVKFSAIDLAKIRYGQDFALTSVKHQNKRLTWRRRIAVALNFLLIFYSAGIVFYSSESDWMSVILHSLFMVLLLALTLIVGQPVLNWRLRAFSKVLLK